MNTRSGLPTKETFVPAGTEQGKPEAPSKPSTNDRVDMIAFGERILRENAALLQTFAKDTSLTFKIGNGFYIDYEKGLVSLDASWFGEKDCSDEQILWACLHEISHFRDLAEDAKAVMANDARMRFQAFEMGDVLSKKVPEADHRSLEAHAYKIFHTFYNCMDDIHVNADVAYRAPFFEADEKGGREVKRLYRKKLFPKSGLTIYPRHLQFAYVLLRDRMVTDDPAEVSEEVRSVLETPLLYKGKKLKPHELVTQYMVPKKGRDTSPKARYAMLQNVLEPIFRSLLLQDLEEWDPKLEEENEGEGGSGEAGDGKEGSGEPGKGDAMPFQKEHDEFSKNSPDQMDEGAMKEWAERHDAETKRGEGKGGEGKSEADKQDKVWRDEHGITKEAWDRFREIENEVAPYITELSRVWDDILSGSSRGMDREREGYFKTGSDLDVQKAIAEFPRIAGGHFEGVRLMTRQVERETKVEKPELIRVRLLADTSGSMTGEKFAMLQKTVVAMLSSFQEFNARLNLTRSRTKTPLRLDSQVIEFGSFADEVKPFEAGSRSHDDRVEMIRMLGRFTPPDGSTSDDAAYDMILGSLDQTQLDRIRNKKVMELIFEITDGSPNSPQRTRARIDSLLAKGVIVRGFQIGETYSEEVALFDSVWNEGRPELLGEHVGSDLSNLPRALFKALKEHLGRVKI